MSRKHLFWNVTVIVTLLQCSLGAPITDLFYLQDELLKDRASDPKYRLPTDLEPQHYKIELSDINLEAQTFSGRVEITFLCVKDTNTIKLHVSSITYDRIAVTVRNLDNTVDIITINTVEENTLYEILTITTDKTLKTNTRYLLQFGSYKAVMSHAMAGFYTSQYTLDGKTERLGTTQMQPVHARKVFPCFDEPGFKANFFLSIQRPGSNTDVYEPTISNMKIDPDASDANNWDRFYETPKMSTYLLAFIVSKFKPLNETTLGDNLFRVFGRPGAGGQGSYAFNEGQKLVNAMGLFMNLDYYRMGNNKMDQAAIPDFSAGAMENWGLLTYREAYLLSDENTSIRYKQQISAILAHEIAHMWFGDYVTCHWWSDTWLNEGFARFFQYKLTDMIESTQFNMMTQFPALQLQRAFISDTPTRSAPLTNDEVNSPAEISDHFGTITYNKGASIIRMMESWLGAEGFQTSLREYVKKNAYGIVTPDKLYEELQKNAPQGRNVANVMSTWVKQSGYPLITVNVNYDDKKMTLSQSRFKKAWESDVNTIYQVPITYATKTKPEFQITSADYQLLTAKSTVINNIPIGGQEWIVLNKQQIGYYRVNYDEKTWSLLKNALIGEERTKIHQLNRGQIVDDLFNLAREDVISYNTTFDVLEFLEKEDDYAPWQSAFAGFDFIRQQLNKNRNLLQRLDNHILNLLKKVTESLGFINDGDMLKQTFRLNTMNFACSLGHSGCLNFSKNAFETFISDNTPVHPNFREFVYCTGLREGTVREFDKLWDKFKVENLANEQLVMMSALGCTRNESKITQLLDEIMKPDSLIRNQDIMTPIEAILNGNLNNPEYLLRYIEDENNFPIVKDKLGSYSTLFTSLGSRLTRHQVNRFHQLILDHADILSKSEITAGMNAYSNLAQQGNFVIETGQEIESWLNEKYGNGGIFATSSIVLLCVTLLAHLFNFQL